MSKIIDIALLRTRTILLAFLMILIAGVVSYIDIPKEAMKDFIKQVTLLSKIAVEKDFTLVEINPLILTEDNKVIALDAKVNIEVLKSTENFFNKHLGL